MTPGASSGIEQIGAPPAQAAGPITNSEAPHGGQDTPTWYDSAWNVPTPDPDALPPSADLVHLRELVTQQDSDGDNTNEHLTAHRTALEYLEPAIDNWSDQLSSVLAKVQEGLIHHQGIIESQTVKLQPLRNDLTTLMQDASQAQRVAEVRSIIDSTVQVVWDSTNATQFLQQRVAVLTQQLERNAERQTLVAKELNATTQLIRANAKRVASKRSARRSPPAAASGKPSAAEDGNIALPPEGTTWPLARPDGQSRKLHYKDPHASRPSYQRWMGLHQLGNPDWQHLTSDKQFLQTATLALISQYQVANRVHMPHEVHLAFTRFDAPLAGNLEILANLTTLGLKFTQAAQWKQGSKLPTIVASAECMTELLWEYLLHASVCTNGMAMAIQMDRQQEDDTQDFYRHGELSRYGRMTLTAADIPNVAQQRLAVKGIHVKIQPRSGEPWYRALLVNGLVELCFRTSNDMAKYEALPLSEKPFLVSTSGSAKRMLGAINAAGAEADSAPLGRHKLDLLFIPLVTDLSKIVALLQEAGIVYSGMERHAMGKNDAGGPTTSRVTIGFHSPALMAACSQALYGVYRPEIKAKGDLLCAIQYDVPRNHCYKCYYPGGPKQSRGHKGKDCTQDPLCDVCHEPHETAGCGWITAQTAVVTHRHDVIPESVYHARNAARNAAFINQGFQWGSQAGSQAGGSQFGGPMWGSPSEVESVIQPGGQPNDPPRAEWRTAWEPELPRVVGVRGPPSPTRTAEDVFGMPVPTYDQLNRTTRGGTPTEGGWNQPTSSRREDRGHYDGLARYEAARRASNAEQERFRPSFADERRTQQGSPATPPPRSAYEDRSQSQHSRNPPAQPTFTYSPDMGVPNARPRRLNREPT